MRLIALLPNSPDPWPRRRASSVCECIYVCVCVCICVCILCAGICVHSLLNIWAQVSVSEFYTQLQESIFPPAYSPILFVTKTTSLHFAGAFSYCENFIIVINIKDPEADLRQNAAPPHLSLAGLSKYVKSPFPSMLWVQQVRSSTTQFLLFYSAL